LLKKLLYNYIAKNVWAGRGFLIEYDATITLIFGLPPYIFFAVVGIVFAASIFILLLATHDYNLPKYTKILFISAIGLLLGGRLFGALTGLYIALAGGLTITTHTFTDTGIVFYGGMIGFVLSFLLICKIWDKEIDHGIMDLVAVCIPIFHFWGRLGCFFGGCCFGLEVEADTIFSVIYTTHIAGEHITATRFPIQLLEASINLLLFAILLALLWKQKLRGYLIILYLVSYAVMRIVLEFFRGDLVRGVWNGVSFSQVVSVIVLICCAIFIVIKRPASSV